VVYIWLLRYSLFKNLVVLYQKQTKHEDAQHTTRDSQLISVYSLVYHSHFGIWVGHNSVCCFVPHHHFPPNILPHLKCTVLQNPAKQTNFVEYKFIDKGTTTGLLEYCDNIIVKYLYNAQRLYCKLKAVEYMIIKLALQTKKNVMQFWIVKLIQNLVP